MRSLTYLCACVGVIGSVALAGCGGGSSSNSQPISVSITSPTSAPTIQAGQTVNITASVANDSSNKGVTWTLTGSGTLSSETATSAIYNAPPTVSANTTATVTATSAANTSKSASLRITVTPVPAISVTITNPINTIAAGAAAVTLNATVQNDSTNSGVTWTLTAGGSACSPTCGSLGGATTTSAIYTPPASVPTSPDNAPVITATSVADTSATSTDPFTVTAPAAPISVTIANPITTIAAGAAAVTVNATVQNDSTNSGVTWTLTADGSACSPTCGSLSGATTASVTYTPPTTTPASPDNAPTISAASVADTSATASDPFTITAAVVHISVAIANPITTIDAGAAAVTLNATVQNDSTNSGVTWTLTAGGSACSPTCGSLSGATTASVTYTPPTSVPTSPDNSPTITATSVADTTRAASDAFTITSATTNNDGLLKGQYALMVNGFDTALAASISANGNGRITGGEEDWIDAGADDDVNVAIASGSYTVGSDNRGTLTFTDASGNVFSFAIALGTVSSGVATRGKTISFSASLPAMSGVLALQDSTAFSTSALSGSYAFGFPGWDGNDDPTVSVGSFTASSGTVTNGLFDQNDDGTLKSSVAFTGSFSTVDSDGRTELAVSTGGSSSEAIPCYVVSSGQLLCAAYEGGEAVSYGQILQQTGGPYTAASLKGNTIYEEQAETGVPSPHEVLGILAFDGTSSASASFDVDDGGGADSPETGTATYTVSSATNGRITVTPAGGSSEILYMIGPNHAFALDENTYPGFGTLEGQSAGTFSNSSLQGTYVIGTLPLVSPPAPGTGTSGGPSLTLSSGVLTAAGTGSATLTADTYSCSVGTCAAQAGTPGTETYSVGSNGRVTFGSGDSTILYIVSPAEFYFLTFPSGATANPTIGVGNQ